jgi:hypothetical protein
MSRTQLLLVCTLVASLVVFVGMAAAQNPSAPTGTPNVYNVDYFSNANTNGAPDGTLRIINPGFSGGNLCADIYVFDVNEEMSECCSCTTTPDGLLTLSVNNDLTSNPLTGPPLLTTGVIKIVSAATTGGLCPVPTTGTPAPTLREWTTHVQNGGTITENPSQEASLSLAEGKALSSQCSAIVKDGSGHGICANSAALAAICNN